MNPLLAPLLAPLISALAGLLFARSSIRVQKVIGLMGTVLNSAGAAWLTVAVVQSENGVFALRAGSWDGPFGIVLAGDRLSAGLVSVSAVIALATAIYSMTAINDRRIRLHYFPLFHFLMLGVNGAFLTADLFNLYVWFEVMLISSFVLIALGNEKAQLEGALKYVALNLVSSALFLSAAGLIYGITGTLNFADLAVRLGDSEENVTLISTSAFLLLVSFGIKAGAFPLFFWLPASYHTPPVAVSALFAGLLTKVGVYALIRAYTISFSAFAETIQPILIFTAAATMVTGVLGAAAQFEIRRILSFHIISQIGYMLMGLALLTAASLAGAIFYIIHHIIVKANLFLIGGMVEKLKGTSQLKKIGGLYHTAPLLGILFLIPALSLGGIPPLSGFWAKFIVIKAGLEAHAYILVGVALVVGVLTLYSMTKIWAEAFWKAQPDDVGTPPEKPGRLTAAMVIPTVSLAALTLFIGFWAEPLFAFSEEAAELLVNPQPYIDAVLEQTIPTEVISVKE